MIVHSERLDAINDENYRYTITKINEKIGKPIITGLFPLYYRPLIFEGISKILISSSRRFEWAIIYQILFLLKSQKFSNIDKHVCGVHKNIFLDKSVPVPKNSNLSRLRNLFTIKLTESLPKLSNCPVRETE